MCGITGLVRAPRMPQALALEAVQCMIERMRPRGPDAEGLWESEGVVLGHRRLAIIDLVARANQPMVSTDGRYAIVFNGEIYNYRELREELDSKGSGVRGEGHGAGSKAQSAKSKEQGASVSDQRSSVSDNAWFSNSDTEVLLRAYAKWGRECVNHLRGMFAFAIWDNQTRELFMVRDPYGIKPLYYTSTKDGFVFASQVKALLASEVVSTECEPAGLAGFYLWGSVPEPWTLFRGVLALPAGHWLRVRGGVADAPVCWHDVRAHWQTAAGKTTAQELQERVRHAVTDSVRAHLVADVPVSVFLSSGIDSAVIAGLASELGARVEGITIGFQDFTGRHEDEMPVAATIAAHYGLPHHARMVSCAEFAQDMPRILDAMDQPSIDGVNTWFASKAAAERGYKVVLSGVGGDEIFCGYSLFRQLPPQAMLGRALAAIPGARALLGLPCAYLARRRSQPKLAGVPEFLGSLEAMYFLRRGLFLPSELPALLGADLAREGLARLDGVPPGMTPARVRNGAAAVGLLESTLYLRNQLLRDSDWASMGHSLELRTPLVDAKLLETLGPFVSSFAGGAGKAMLAQSPKKSLPGVVVSRPKTGFSLPMAKWLSEINDQRRGTDLPLLTAPGTPWARRWARAVLAKVNGCG